MSDEKVLTKEIAEQFLADEDSVDLSEFTAIEDDGAEIIGKASVHPFFTGLKDTTELPWIDLQNIKSLSANALSSLRPDLTQLANIFCERMKAPIAEIEDNKTTSLEINENTAVAGFNALFGEWCDGSSQDEVLSVWSETPTGNDVYGESLEAHRLYFTVPDHYLDDETRSGFSAFLGDALGSSALPSDEVTSGGVCVGDSGYYLPINRFCKECLTEKEWPHTELSGCNNGSLSLGIIELSKEQAGAIAAMTGKVFLNEVTDISETVADIVSKGTVKVSLAGLKSIPPTQGHLLLLKRTAETNEELYLWQLEEMCEKLAQHLFDLCKNHDGLYIASPVLSDQSLATLIRIQGCFGWGVRDLSDSQAELICQHNADVSLDELTSLSDEAATRLSQFPYGLSLDLEKIPPSAAEILRSHPSFAESEDDEDDDWDDED
jgi:hypothetical protein